MTSFLALSAMLTMFPSLRLSQSGSDNNAMSTWLMFGTGIMARLSSALTRTVCVGLMVVFLRGLTLSASHDPDVALCTSHVDQTRWCSLSYLRLQSNRRTLHTLHSVSVCSADQFHLKYSTQRTDRSKHKSGKNGIFRDPQLGSRASSDAEERFQVVVGGFQVIASAPPTIPRMRPAR
jgi:hypothetical protein